MSLSSAFAASASLSVSGGGSYNVGDSVRVTFTISGSNLGNGTAEIKYDSSVLQYTGGLRSNSSILSFRRDYSKHGRRQCALFIYCNS